MISINFYVIAMQMLNFAILLWLLNKVLVKPLSQFIEKREKSIQNNIEYARADKEAAEKTLKQSQEELQKAFQEAKEVRQNAEAAITQEREQVVNQAKQEARQILDTAKEEITANVESAKKSLKAEIGRLAIGLSERLIKENLSDKSQEALVKEYANKN